MSCFTFYSPICSSSSCHPNAKCTSAQVSQYKDPTCKCLDDYIGNGEFCQMPQRQVQQEGVGVKGCDDAGAGHVR